MPKIHVVLATTALLLAVVATPASAARGGRPGSPISPDAIWADGELRGTVPQGELRYNGNDRSYDLLIGIDGQAPVAEAAPGNPDYNGGRWLPVSATWTGGATPTVLTSYAAVLAAVDAGDLVLGTPDSDGTFLCPLIPNR